MRIFTAIVVVVAISASHRRRRRCIILTVVIRFIDQRSRFHHDVPGRYLPISKSIKNRLPSTTKRDNKQHVFGRFFLR